MATTPRYRREFTCDLCGDIGAFGFSYHAWCVRHYYYAQIIGLLARILEPEDEEDEYAF